MLSAFLLCVNNFSITETCKTSQNPTVLTITIGVVIVFVVIITSAGIIVLMSVNYKKKMKFSISREVFDPHGYENPLATNIELVSTSQGTVTHGESGQQSTPASMDIDDNYEVVDQQTMATTTETDMTYEEVEQQPRAARNENSAAVEQQTADTTTDTDGMGYILVEEPAAATRMNTNIAYGVIP